jgi:hypothetical protein
VDTIIEKWCLQIIVRPAQEAMMTFALALPPPNPWNKKVEEKEDEEVSKMALTGNRIASYAIRVFTQRPS